MGVGRNIAIWLGAFLLLTILFKAFEGNTPSGGSLNLPFSDFIQKLDKGDVAEVVIRQTPEDGTILSGHFGDGASFTSLAPTYPNLVDRLSAKNVKITVAPMNTGSSLFWSTILSWFPFLLLVGVYIFFMRQMQGGGGRGGAMGFGKSRARLLNEKSEKKMFADVAGVNEAKEELVEIVDFLKDPAKFQRLGGKIPKGCLLVGPPGTGKTLLARAVAGEAGVPFFSISGSDFVEMFVGVGASRVRDMFEQGKKNAPCIIFIDEIDAVGRHRGAGIGGGNDEREQTLNQMLVEMDGFESSEGVILIAATNRPDVLDPALLRPGRFDRQIVVSNPDIAGRDQILQVHLKKVPMGPDVDPKIIARGTPGFSGADLANLVNEAALLAARRDRKVVTMRELEEAKDKVMMGVERKSMVMSDEEKKMTAYHEAGHALVAFHCPASDPVHKATIIPRGRALGMVMRLPEADKISYLRDKMHADLAVSMGGRVAEEMIFGYDRVSSGAISDIRHATALARAMVTQWGMSDALGPVNYADSQEAHVLSNTVAAKVDEEVRNIVEAGLKKATDILTEYRHELELLGQSLLEYETLSGDEIRDLLAGKKLHRDATESITKTVRSRFPSSRKVEDTTQQQTSEEGDSSLDGDSAPQQVSDSDDDTPRSS